MPSNLLSESPLASCRAENALEQEIMEKINEESVLSLDGLILLMPHRSWNQIFHAVDRLARSGRIVLRRHRFDYTLFSAHYAA
jgi:hypothetical protein